MGSREQPSLTAGRGRSVLFQPLVGEVRRSTIVRQEALARALHCDVSSVSRMVSALCRGGVLTRRERLGAGRAVGQARIRPVELSAGVGVLVGLDMTERHVRLAITDAQYAPLTGLPWPPQAIALRTSREHRDERLDEIVELLVDALRRVGEQNGQRLIGVGLCLPGPIRRRGVPASASILPGWQEADVRRALQERLLERGVCPARRESRDWVEVENDASAGALGVFTHALLESGDGQAPEDLVYVRVSRGVGAGIVLKRHLVTGGWGFAGEIGHMRIHPDGPLCPACGGRGCLETVASERAFMRELGALPDESIQRFVSEENVARLLEEHMTLPADPDEGIPGRAGTPTVEQALWEAGWYMGLALAQLCQVLNPRRIVMGGLIPTSVTFQGAVRHAIARSALPQVRDERAGFRIETWERRAADFSRRTAGMTPELLGILARVLDELGDPYLLPPVQAWVNRGGHKIGTAVDWKTG